MPSHKVDRIASDIQKYINEIIITEARDEILKSVTITGCKVTNDLSFCKVYFTSLIDMDKKQLEKGFEPQSVTYQMKIKGQVELAKRVLDLISEEKERLGINK